MFPADDPSWASYFDTILLLGEAPGLLIDLRVWLTDDVRQALSRLGLPQTFAILTACNPRGQDLAAAENTRRHHDLLKDLSLRNLTTWPADGLSPDGRHREQGVAVALDRSSAHQLATSCEQSAFFWYDGHRFHLVGALVQTPPVALPPGERTDTLQSARP